MQACIPEETTNQLYWFLSSLSLCLLQGFSLPCSLPSTPSLAHPRSHAPLSQQQLPSEGSLLPSFCSSAPASGKRLDPGELWEGEKEWWRGGGRRKEASRPRLPAEVVWGEGGREESSGPLAEALQRSPSCIGPHNL